MHNPKQCLLLPKYRTSKELVQTNTLKCKRQTDEEAAYGEVIPICDLSDLTGARKFKNLIHNLFKELIISHIQSH